MPEPDQHDRLLGPESAEGDRVAIEVQNFGSGERVVDLHGRDSSVPGANRHKQPDRRAPDPCGDWYFSEVSLLLGASFVAVLQAQPGAAEGSVPSPASEPAPAPSEPEIQRPKSVTADPAAPAAPAPAAAPAPSETPAAETEPPSPAAVPATAAPVEPEPAEPSVPDAVPRESEVIVESAPEPALELPEETGRGLMIGSIATGALGWTMSVSTIGLLAKGCTGLSDCLGQVETLVLLGGIRWAANGVSLGLAIPAGIRRARYDATQDAIAGTGGRDPDVFVKGGAAALGVGAASWVILRVGLFTFFQNCGGRGCGIGYLAGLQTSFAVASAGSGVLSYGLAYRKQQREFGSAAQVRVVPQVSPQYSGLSLAGRF